MSYPVWLNPAAFEGACPICGSAGGHLAEIETPHPLEEDKKIRYIRCCGCASLFTDPPTCLDYELSMGFQDRQLRMYLEAGAGIHAMLRRAASVKGARGKRFLDVGCGFGFAPDAWRRLAGPDAAGIELARYGRIGAARLGVTIHDRLLGQIPALAGQRFDVVQAIEVIEHVPDARAFLADLDAMLALGGVLALSTPCADFVRPNDAPAEMMGLLFPGFHAFLYSKKALESVLQERFPYVQVVIERETLSAWASHQPFELDPALAEEIYMPYLEQLWSECIGRHDDVLHDGIAYRLFKEKLNRGDTSGAAAPMSALEDSYRRKYGPGVLDPAAAAEWGDVADIAAYDRLPYSLAAYHFFRAIYARLAENDALRAAHGFAAAARIALAGGKVAPAKFVEALSLVWIARQQEGLAWAATGDNARAAAVFNEILAARAGGGLPVYPDDALVRAVAQNRADVAPVPPLAQRGQ